MNTSKVTDISSMFSYAKWVNPDVSKWNTSNVTDMRWMFHQAKSANPDVSGWNTSKVTDMNNMFAYTDKANPDVSKWNTSNVTNMSYMFTGATKAIPDVSNWEVSCIEYMSDMFKDSGIRRADLSKWILNEELLGDKVWSKYLFTGCSKLEYLKTPAGLKTNINGANNNFKILRLKRGSLATIEKNDQNLNEEYVINKDADKGVVYHIYRKDKYAGVTFNKNGGDEEAWANHEILEKGKSIDESGGHLPTENPKLAGDEFLGWTTERDIVSSEFDNNTKVNEDTTVYALWKK